jgi:hypothetical protein
LVRREMKEHAALSTNCANGRRNEMRKRLACADSLKKRNAHEVRSRKRGAIFAVLYCARFRGNLRLGFDANKGRSQNS